MYLDNNNRSNAEEEHAVLELESRLPDADRPPMAPVFCDFPGMSTVSLEQPDLRLAGDFYNLPQNVSRGVELLPMPAEPPMFGLHHPGEDNAFMPGIPGLPYDFELKPSPMDKVHSVPEVAYENPEFPEGVPPAQEPFCGFSTSVQLPSGVGAAQAARIVYEFLRSKASSFSKVTPQKFAMKATVFHQINGACVSCLVKARVFASASTPRGLTVEFRRCNGDALAFHQLFEEVSNDLRLNCGLAPVESPMMPISVPPPDAGESKGAYLQPLVDMVGCEAPHLEAEAVAALAAVVGASTAGATAILSAMSDVQKILEDLCVNRTIDIAYPAARLASGLVQNGEAQCVSELTMAALRGAATDHIDGLVRMELAEAVRAVACKCATPDYVSSCVSRVELQQALEEAFANSAMDESSGVTRCLREALYTLEATPLNAPLMDSGVMA